MSYANNNNDNSNPSATPPVVMWETDSWKEENAGKLLDDHTHKGICYGMSLA